MPIIKCRDHLEAYRHKARARDIHELSGRTGRPELTRFISEGILEHLKPQTRDTVVDIGCGDGGLLRLLEPRIATGVGILPTEEEVNRVRKQFAAHSCIQINQGVAQDTQLSAAFADQVVCNGVLLLLSENDVDRALREIARIGKPGALVFLGEIPVRDEMAERTYGDSISKWLWWVLRRQGCAAFRRRAGQVIRSLFTTESLLVTPKTQFHCTPERFIARLQKSGWQSLAYFPHRELSPEGEEQTSNTRFDYIFQLP